MTLDRATDIADIIAPLVATVAIIAALFVYVRQTAQKRAEFFISLRAGLKGNESFKEISNLLELETALSMPGQELKREEVRARLREIPFAERRDLLGLFEDVAIMQNSGGIRPEVASYMFGYYVLQCWRSDAFWYDINRKSPAWRVFNRFAVEMQGLEERRTDAARIRF
jgi:hypothetical protein